MLRPFARSLMYPQPLITGGSLKLVPWNSSHETRHRFPYQQIEIIWMLPIYVDLLLRVQYLINLLGQRSARNYFWVRYRGRVGHLLANFFLRPY